MKIDVRRFATMRRGLEEERNRVRARLAELDRALGAMEGSTSAPAANRARTAASAAGVLSMRQAIAKATARGPLGPVAIVPAIIDLGFRFKSKKPVNSVGAYLYGPEGKKYFRKVEGGFVAK